MEKLYGKYYTAAQRAEIRAQGQEPGQERIRQVEAEWSELIAQVRAEIERGTDPANEHVQQLARRWIALVAEFTGGNPAIEQALRTMYEREPKVRQQTGTDLETFTSISKAIATSQPAEP